MNATCPHCTARLSNTTARPMGEAKLLASVHALGGRYVHTVATHQVIGECVKHGIVTTTVREQRV